MYLVGWKEIEEKENTETKFGLKLSQIYLTVYVFFSPPIYFYPTKQTM
jgi:hypothetical protein